MGLALDWAGFVSNVAQDADTLARLRIAIFLVPAVVVAASGAAICFFGVNNAQHPRIVEDIAAGVGAGDPPPSESPRAACGLRHPPSPPPAPQPAPTRSGA